MKENRNLLFGMVFGTLIIGTLAFLCMPAIVQGTSFLLGFMASLIVVTFVLTIVFIKRRKSPSATKAQTFIGLLLAALVVIAGIVGGYIIMKQYELLEEQKRYQEKQNQHQSQLKESIRIKGQMVIMGNLMNTIEAELNQDSRRALSDESISRIADLSHSLSPDAFNYVEVDSLSEHDLSQERGQLLLILLRMQIDSISFRKIMDKTSFAKADLQGADLKGTNLNGIDLMSANLKGADLSHAEVIEADLRGVNLWGANLSKADLSKTALNRVDLRWANMDEVVIKDAILEGSVLTNAKLREADLTNSYMRYSNLSGALLIEATLVNVIFFGSNFSEANLTGANLKMADLKTCSLYQTILDGADLSEVAFRDTKVHEKTWLLQLDKWQVAGAKKLQEQYKIIKNASGKLPYSIQTK